jgi:hypothetical protein
MAKICGNKDVITNTTSASYSASSAAATTIPDSKIDASTGVIPYPLITNNYNNAGRGGADEDCGLLLLWLE